MPKHEMTWNLYDLVPKGGFNNQLGSVVYIAMR